MASFETLKEKAYHAAGVTADTAKQFATISKCRLEILAQQERIRSLYTKLGKVYYKDYVTDEEPDEAEYMPLCDRISDCYRRINELREEIAEAKATYQEAKVNYKSAKEQQQSEEEELIALAVAEEHTEE